MIEIIPNWHPIWVHFAVALLITSAGFYLLFGWRRTPQAGKPSNALIVARWTLWLGVFAAAGALLTGYWASGSVAHDDLGHANMMVHRNWAFAAGAIFMLAAFIEFLKKDQVQGSIITVFLVLAGSVALAATGLEGAENVYEHGLGVQRLPQVSTHEHSGSGHEQSDQADNGGHGHDQAVADDEQSAGENESGDGHSHSHAEAPATQAVESTMEDSDHPASLVAAQLGDAIAAGDVDTLRLLLAPDVLIFESGGVESSLAEYEGHHMPADMTFMGAMEREVMSRHVFDSSDSATVVTRSRVRGMYKEQDIDLTSTETLVMKKVGGQWKIVHIHWSSG